ncbi:MULTISPECIES: stage II sporulation protein R [unclassified Paenibacillus]|uniref:stage II sporulation protein R n=1 Tax=unclassified Paenibacillus TaxID=185978 RepID=UPI001AEA3A17|nr:MULTISPECIES: stage II sporulation protein R [unclassified Paenibacillus]MBP1153220.1 stage II sporulation protein R [Paenibacillus sp. PvP091]MBP1171397.1 stage II sporulation protein R [Paenibacillus sp. PvR098]MBP2442425.1 stage II sporulation protein R [Paenibacillus sp. PvP052]
MVKRFAWKRYAYLVFAFMVLLACWESQRSNVVLFASPAGSGEVQSSVIPQESIRLRILAHSDAALDQWLKREVRDAILEQMNGWVAAPQGIEAAREVVREHLPELEALVGETLRKNGFDYSYKVELGVVPFPTKMYGNQVYPAGEYEALRVSIGAAEGQNWWCVLFPPLCFIDSEMVVKKNTAYAAEAEASEQEGQASNTDIETKASAAKEKMVSEENASAAAEPEVRFFLWDMIKTISSWFA